MPQEPKSREERIREAKEKVRQVVDKLIQEAKEGKE